MVGVVAFVPNAYTMLPPEAVPPVVRRLMLLLRYSIPTPGVGGVTTDEAALLMETVAEPIKVL